MNIPKFIAFVLSLFVIPFAYADDTVAGKHALVVAISDYSPGSGFRHIFADNDAKIIAKLLSQQGFDDTIVLRNGQADKAGFLEAFATLRSRVRPGDAVWIHFSTHGQQIRDMSGDETDGLDEAIALYDARSVCTDAYKGENHLTDDEFGSLIEQLRNDLGKDGDILVLVDACHSGTITRGDDTVNIRGGYPPLIPSPNAVPVTRGVLAGDEKVGMFCNTDNPGGTGKANYVIISACDNSEVSSEFYYNHNYFGPLTWAFLNAMLNSTGEDYTYKKLFHDIQYKMISMFEACRTPQHPTMESADVSGPDKIIFGGRNIVQQPFFTITAFDSPGVIRIQGGTVSGIFDSTTVTVCPAGTMDPGKPGAPVARGVVIRSGYMESVVRLYESLVNTDPGDYWVFADRRKFGAFRISIGLGSFTNQDLKTRTLDVLRQSSCVRVTQADPGFLLRQNRDGKERLSIDFATSHKMYRGNIPPEDLEKVLLRLAQSQFLKELQVSAPGIRLEVAFLPGDTIRHSVSEFIDPKTSRYTFREKADTAVLRIINTGTASVYFNILDIDPQDHIQVIFPNNDRPLSDCFLKPGQVFTALNTFGEPYGTEILKVIASDRKFDLRPLIGPDGPDRGTSSLPEPAAVATFNLFFDVIK